MRLLYYRPSRLLNETPDRFPGLAMFSQYFKIYGPSVAVVDRSSTIRLPVAIASHFPIPALVPFKKTYEDVCMERAAELLTRADALDVDIYVSWSGGIDSTTVLVSLLKAATQAQRKRLVVLLSEESISEYPRFWEEHVRGKLRVESAILFSYRLGTNDILVDGELNDQILGSDMSTKLINRFGESVLHKPYDRDLFFSLFGPWLADDTVTNFYLDLFGKLAAASPIDLPTNFLHLWWINFTLKWQFVYMRRLHHTARSNIGAINQEYLDTRFMHFFSTDDFQRWSLANPDKRIKDTWSTYKWQSKDVIYSYTKDTEYRDHKVKRGSLRAILRQQQSYSFIDDRFTFYDDLEAEKYFVPDNDFV